MSELNNILLKVAFSAIFLYQISLVENMCVDNNFSLSNEEDNNILIRYLEKLEFYTGLSSTKPSIPVNCPNPECVVNPQGSAIWEARLKFYVPYVVNSSVDAKEASLDGCVCHSTNYENFQTCLQDVRRTMLVELDTTLIQDFRRIIESDDCRSYTENCLQIF